MATYNGDGSSELNVLELAGVTQTVGTPSISILQCDSSLNVTQATGATLPTLADAGYAKGCEFIVTGGSVGTTVYRNEGPATSCDFRAASGAGAQIAVVSLTAAQIIAMYTTPVTLVAAPAAGTAIAIDSISVKMTTTATQFTAGGAVEFRYTNGAGTKVTADVAAAVVTTTAGTSYTKVGGIEASLTMTSAAAVVMTNATQVFATGTGTAVVTVVYHLVQS